MTQSSRIPYSLFFSYVGYIIFSIFLAAAILELGATMVRSVHHWMHPVNAQSLAKTPPYQGYPWAQEFWNEEFLRRAAAKTSRYVPFLIWGERPWHSKHINVDESAIGNLRRTVNSSYPGCNQAERKVIWMFGGSTLFGMGVPDEETIASHLSRELNTSGRGCFEIVNLGMEGYVTNQELILLVENLKTEQRPDVAIFYDGVNEAYAAAAPGIPGKPTPHLEFQFIKGRVEGSVGGALDFLRESNSFQLARAIAARFRRSDSGVSGAEATARAKAALDNYEANIRVLRNLAHAYNCKVFFFWQPSLASGNKPLTPFEEQFRSDSAGSSLPNSFAILKAVNEEAGRRAVLSADFIFLGTIFDSVQEPVYIDHLMHLGPRGNQMVAHAMAKSLDKLVDK
ncbi:MAG TPA: SGNH/GDSL hydrolase family protein [Candidatus Acidoferrum sp.]|jgi:lysophospholipase L1-like esterase